MFGTHFSQLKKSALHFSENEETFYQDLGDIGKSPLDLPVLKIAKKIFENEPVRYCGKPISEFPFTFQYLQASSYELRGRVKEIVELICNSKKLSEVNDAIGKFLIAARVNTQSIHFGLASVPVIQHAHREAGILKEKTGDLTDPSVFIALPLLISLRLLMQEGRFTKENCPVIFIRSTGMQKLAQEALKEEEIDHVDSVVSYLNQMRDRLVSLQIDHPGLFTKLEERIYGNLSKETLLEDIEVETLYRGIHRVSGAISFGDRASILNYCMKLAIDSQ